jgi:phosphoglycerate dehydrogenase-like enzyme
MRHLYTVLRRFWILNTSGKNIVTTDLVAAMRSGKILGAGLDVLEYENCHLKPFFKKIKPQKHSVFRSSKCDFDSACCWLDFESHERLAQVIVDKIKLKYFGQTL